MHVGERSLSGGGDAVVSGVGEPVCGVSSVMTAGALNICGCDSLESGGAGDSSGVEVVDDLAGGDDTLLHDAVSVDGWLSVVGDTLMRVTGVARSDRGDTGVVAGPGVTKSGWVDGLICADDSLRPEPPPMHAMCLCRSLLAAALKGYCIEFGVV